MTTFLLAGGDDRAYPDFGQKLHDLIIQKFEKPRILSCFFAKPKSEWQDAASSWQSWFEQYFSDLSYVVADPNNFVEQINSADVIYLHGGQNEALLNQLLIYADLPKAFENKVIVASSAGANYLSVMYWTRSKSQVAYGAGVIPYGIMVHYGSLDGGFNDNNQVSWDDAEKRLRHALPAQYPIVKISEGDIFVFND